MSADAPFYGSRVSAVRPLSTWVALCALCLSVAGASGCSGDSGDEKKEPQTAAGGSAATSSGGAPGAGGSQAVPCTADTGDSPCRECLAAECCSALEACLADATCSAALDEHEACFGTPGADPSECFGAFARTIAAVPAGAQAVAGCIINKCTGLICGAPQVV